jgi:hypothetical protein
MSYNEQIENYLGSSGEVAYKGKLIWNLFHINSYRIFAINTIFSITSICIKSCINDKEDLLKNPCLLRVLFLYVYRKE